MRNRRIEQIKDYDDCIVDRRTVKDEEQSFEGHVYDCVIKWQRKEIKRIKKVSRMVEIRTYWSLLQERKKRLAS